MGAHLWVFLGISAVVIVVPGPDTALVTKNAVLHGRRAALGTAFGVEAGLSVWTLACAFGVASVIEASATAFTALKLIGAAYLVWLGVQALLAARRGGSHATAPRSAGTSLSALGGFRQGLLSDLANPKIAAFFTSVLPQFAGSGHSVLVPFLVMGGLFVVMTVVWLCTYALAAVKASELLRRRRVSAAIDRLSGAILIGFGVRLALERR
ncbi:MAG TPA: LysE family translocator [Solirubrobacteraceae bacterium]|nr:LysE family translocator [Solirubrobacteraceae bacterium]